MNARLQRFCRLLIASHPWVLTLLLRSASLLLFLSRSRLQDSGFSLTSDKPSILFIDSSTPQSDRDAGAVTIVQYMHLFVDHGWDVYLCPFDQIERADAVGQLNQSGIHVVFPARHALIPWLRRNASSFQVIFLSRPTMAATLLPILRSEQSITAYYGHDLHFQRFRQEAFHSGHGELNWIARRFRSVERSISRRVDISYYPSADEVMQLQALEPDATIKELPAYCYDFDQLPEIRLKASRRFLFIGNFRHQPNVDAVSWLLQAIWPCIRLSLDGVELSIVGSNPPADLMHMTRRHQDIHWKGWVSDAELSYLYQTSRIVLVPLRYGAGVKHKVVAAVVEGCAVVTTTIGLQGLPELMDLVGLAKTPDDFAVASSRLMMDDSLWLYRVAAARNALSARFSSQSMWRAFDDLHHSI